ncbi:MAG TPA: Mur ligase family protein [Spirochaetota bacterium]|nr:Mur ligase family protein [Spirochaetota bacterium]
MSSRPRTLDSLVDNEQRTGFAGYTPENITRLLELSGNPHRALACAHIAGTNGKGSTAHYLHAMLSAAGFRAGLYTSPHLVRVNERIRVGGEEIPDDDLARHTEGLFDMLEGNPDIAPTWFDALTFIAFRHFHERRVDFAVIETGLGGRLDSTNVVTPLVSIITSVGLDHTHLLGGTVREIAHEKAGIVKPGIPVVTACGGEALDVIEKTAGTLSSPLLVAGREFSAGAREAAPGGQRFDYAFSGARDAARPQIILKNLFIPQAPPVQATNAALAVTAALLMRNGTALPDRAIRDGLRGTSIPGRFELLLEKPAVYFDPAHNPAALTALLDMPVIRDFPGGRAAVVHFMADKDIDGMLALIQNQLTRRIFYVTSGTGRSWSPDTATTGKKGLIPVAGARELAAALRALGDDTVVLFTGSFRLYEIAREVAGLLKEKDNGIVSRGDAESAEKG